MIHRATPSTYYTADLTFKPDKVLLDGLPGGLLQLDIHGGQLSIDHPNYTVAILVENKGPEPTPETGTANSLAEIKARWFTDKEHRAEYWADLASHDIPVLIELAARFEAIFDDCARHRNRAEKRARHYMNIVRAIESIIAPDEEGVEEPDGR